MSAAKTCRTWYGLALPPAFWMLMSCGLHQIAVTASAHQLRSGKDGAGHVPIRSAN